MIGLPKPKSWGVGGVLLATALCEVQQWLRGTVSILEWSFVDTAQLLER